MMDFEQLNIGDEKVFLHCIEAEDVDRFAALSGDDNPLHMDEGFAKSMGYRSRVVHGILSMAYISKLIGMDLPGPGALWTEQRFRFLKPVYIGDEIEYRVRVQHKSSSTRMLVIHISAHNQSGEKILDGEGHVALLSSDRAAVAFANGFESIRTVANVSAIEGSAFSNIKAGDSQQSSKTLALITGSSRGIGSAIATQIAALGIPVIVNYHTNRLEAEKVCQRIEESGGRAIAIQADVTNRMDLEEMIKRGESELRGTISILVNNAGGSIPVKNFLESEWQEIDRHWQIQVKAAFDCTQLVLPGMIQDGWGRIVNIGSIFTWGVPPNNLTGYVIAKNGLKGLTKSLANEFGPKGITVNMISPGMTETELIADIPERIRKVNAMQTPLRRLASPRDIAGVVAMLVSPAGNYINGADIPVCGGKEM